MKRLQVISFFCLMFLFIGALVYRKKTFAVMKVTSVIYYLSNAGNFSQFSNLLVESNVDALLSKISLIGAEGGFTVFAPTDKAFFDFGQVGVLRSKKEDLREFIKYHVVVGKQLSERDLKPGARFQTLAGEMLDVSAIGSIEYSVKVTNGVIYILDHVLINPSIKNKLRSLPTSASASAAGFNRYSTYVPYK